MSGEELLAEARKHMWAAWQLSAEELASQAASTLLGLGMLVPEGGAAELEKLRARVAELEALTAQATEFRLWEPGYGLYVRRAPGAQGFAVMEALRTNKGRRCWTTAGWQYASVLSDTELFCWPDAQTAVTEAQRVMPGATVREEPEGGDAR